MDGTYPDYLGTDVILEPSDIAMVAALWFAFGFLIGFPIGYAVKLTAEPKGQVSTIMPAVDRKLPQGGSGTAPVIRTIAESKGK